MLEKRDLKLYSKFIVIGLLILMLILEISSALKENQTIDEATHLAAGYSYWKTGDFRMNPEHPALFKLISSFPLLFLKLNLPTNDPSWQQYNEWSFGHEFLYHNTEPADKILFLGRLPTMLISLLLGFFIYKWAKELFGYKAGIFALFLYVLEPNIIAHSRYVTNDIQITFFFVLSIYYFGKYLKNPTFKNLTVASLVFAISQVIKFSAIILVPILLILFIIKRWQNFQNREKNVLNLKKIGLGIMIFIFLTFLIIFISYGFELKTPLKDQRVVRLYQEREEMINTGSYTNQPFYLEWLIKHGDPQIGFGKFLYKFANKIPVPAFTYFRGLFSVLSHNYWGHASYLLGMSGNTGWWYYFIVAFFVKTPLSILVFFGISGFIFFKKFLVRLKSNFKESQIKNKFRSIIFTFKNIPLNYYLISIPPLIYFMWSMSSHINLGVRHIFPVFPFVYLISSSIIKYKPIRYITFYKILFLLTCIFYIFSSFKIYPNYLTYFNEASGGPKNGHKILLDSNLDWGQDVKKLKKYIDENQIPEIRLAYFGTADLDYYGIKFWGIPKNNQLEIYGIPKDIIAISASVLFSSEQEFTWLLNYKPIEVIGNTIYMYNFRKF
jgi:4-amino-4-deoxy-L-arabinose transferase-like glycosyltransferase